MTAGSVLNSVDEEDLSSAAMSLLRRLRGQTQEQVRFSQLMIQLSDSQRGHPDVHTDTGRNADVLQPQSHHEVVRAGIKERVEERWWCEGRRNRRTPRPSTAPVPHLL